MQGLEHCLKLEQITEELKRLRGLRFLCFLISLEIVVGSLEMERAIAVLESLFSMPSWIAFLSSKVKCFAFIMNILSPMNNTEIG